MRKWFTKAVKWFKSMTKVVLDITINTVMGVNKEMGEIKELQLEVAKEVIVAVKEGVSGTVNVIEKGILGTKKMCSEIINKKGMGQLFICSGIGISLGVGIGIMIYQKENQI